VELAPDLGGEHRFPHWSPDGTRISFRMFLPETDTWETYTVPSLGGVPRRYAVPEGYTTGLSWSPTGERIAYGTSDAIFVAATDAGEDRKLTDTVDPSCLSWSPDGSRIASRRAIPAISST
jgi:Tol biopolymer transport system component